jgi:excisionase family DNA binding protein
MKRPSKLAEPRMQQQSTNRFPSVRPLGKLRTIPETAEILQTSERTVQRLVASRKLRAHYIGRLVRIADADIAALLETTRTV